MNNITDIQNDKQALLCFCFLLLNYEYLLLIEQLLGPDADDAR